MNIYRDIIYSKGHMEELALCSGICFQLIFTYFSFIILLIENELYLDAQVSETDHAPSSLYFLRHFVSPNRPLVIRGACKEWPAVKNWTNDYLRNKIGSSVVSVAVTPNGYADAVLESRFTLPEERQITFNKFLDIIEGSLQTNGIFYLQKQNSSLTTEFQGLLEDVFGDISWATEAFGNKPDAVNFWMGDSRAITSLHKDHYENIYCVIRGTKTFTLLPPTDQPFIPYDNFQAAIFKESEFGEFNLEDDLDTGMVRWTPINPLNPDFLKYPKFKKARPITVTVEAGDMFYLPSLWFHHVQQSHGCIAVNYWYDMEYDIKYNYFKFVESLVDKKNSTKKPNECS